MKFTINSPCPCRSGDKYKKCCQPFHKGKLPKTALKLMKSRYSAFSLNIPKYIISTTDPLNKEYRKNTTKWKEEIENFIKNSEFRNLEILEFKDGENEAFVSFKATIFCNLEDCSFIEKSKFIKKDYKWLYLSGEFL